MPTLFHSNGRSVTVPAEAQEFYLGLGWSADAPKPTKAVSEPEAPTEVDAPDETVTDENVTVAVEKSEPEAKPVRTRRARK